MKCGFYSMKTFQRTCIFIESSNSPPYIIKIMTFVNIKAWTLQQYRQNISMKTIEFPRIY